MYVSCAKVGDICVVDARSLEFHYTTWKPVTPCAYNLNRQDSPSPADRKKNREIVSASVVSRIASDLVTVSVVLFSSSLLPLRVVRMRRNVYDGIRKLDEDSRFPPVFTGTLTFDFVFSPSYRVYGV